MAATKNATKKRGRPPKNVIWGNKNKSSWRGRPAKNVIQPRKSKSKLNTEKISPKRITKNKIKKTSKNPTTKTKKIKITKINNTTDGFKTHKVIEDKNKKENNFALRLLIASIILFAFSVYKAFFYHNIEPLNNDIIIQTEPQKNTTWNQQKIVTIDPATLTTTWSIISWTHIDNFNPQEQNKTKYEIPNTTFNIAFTLNEVHPDIETLQKFLANEWVFHWEITWLYWQETLNAVYDFQLKYKILDENAIKQLKWYFGPSTREKVNQIIAQQKQQ